MQIDKDDYQSQVAQVRFGKRVGTSIYFHEECTDDLPDVILTIAEKAKVTARKAKVEFNVYKFDIRTPMVSLLNYPSFFDEAFPTLQHSAIWDITTGSLNVRAYEAAEGRPVLHRKELMLPNGHPKIDEFATLTEVSEQAGLFADASRIGRYGYWSSLLSESNLKVIGHTLCNGDGEPIEYVGRQTNVLRYKTALKRNRLSVPVQVIFKYELVEEGSTFFDYGCGRGDDIRQLCELGIDAAGWDPHFSRHAPKQYADIVNLGYVINVIENADERLQVVSDAFNYAKKLLVVSALVGSSNHSRKARPYKDGVLTSTGSFQRYFQSHELLALIEQSTERKPISVSSGIMFVFKDEELEQRFLAGRIVGHRQPRRHQRIGSVDDLSSDQQAQAERFWQSCVDLGRPASRSEVHGCDDLFRVVPSASRVFDVVSKEKDHSEFDAARAQRKNELLVKFAMSQFGKRLYFKYFPDFLKRDIQFHFGGYSTLVEEAEKLLFSVSDSDALLASCVDASDEGIGYLLGDHSLQLHISLVDQLAPILRVYVGCAGILYGDRAQIDLVKIHIQSGKVSFMGYDDFEGRPVPELLERIKVKMWERKVDFFDYIGEYTPTPLFMKSLFIDDSFDYFSEQSSFDQALMSTRLFDFMRENITKEQFDGALQAAGYCIKGYELVQVA